MQKRVIESGDRKVVFDDCVTLSEFPKKVSFFEKDKEVMSLLIPKSLCNEQEETELGYFKFIQYYFKWGISELTLEEINEMINKDNELVFICRNFYEKYFYSSYCDTPEDEHNFLNEFYYPEYNSEIYKGNLSTLDEIRNSRFCVIDVNITKNFSMTRNTGRPKTLHNWFIDYTFKDERFKNQSGSKDFLADYVDDETIIREVKIKDLKDVFKISDDDEGYGFEHFWKLFRENQ